MTVCVVMDEKQEPRECPARAVSLNVLPKTSYKATPKTGTDEGIELRFAAGVANGSGFSRMSERMIRLKPKPL